MQILGLEFLRGLCALFVAIFHWLSWAEIAELHSWGLYGVYIFFVISGAVLYLNYGDGRTPTDVFLLKRFARLAPLYVAAVIAMGFMSDTWDWRKQLLNVSMLFGFVSPGETSMVTGGWSLGIEFVLYALFP